MQEFNKLILIGNGFDLAHGLQTIYKNFLDWYMCEAFQHFYDKKHYKDYLIEIKNKNISMTTTWEEKPKTFEEVLKFIDSSSYQFIEHPSNFFKQLLNSFKAKNWVDIERYYFSFLKTYFSKHNMPEKKDVVLKLNKEFDFLIARLSDYIKTINGTLTDIPKLKIDSLKYDLDKAYTADRSYKVKFLNFNYTETLYSKGYAQEEDIIHIHGRVAEIDNNPIIFGYGDESDPAYQSIEDSGENVYLEHIKSFGYFRTSNYHKLLSYIDSGPYIVYIIGHSCGLSDRVLLNEIFEHQNCERIEIFYHIRGDGSDNFKEITQEISRHFKPQNKNKMRRKVGHKNTKNIIPQNEV